MFARLGTDYEIRNQWFFAILEAMTTDLDREVLCPISVYGQREKKKIYFE